MAWVADFQGTIHLVFSSHWDREWYLPFQKFRGKLVKMLDGVLQELESGRLPVYQMDGQFIPVEDYLKIRPEKEALLRQLIAEGRFRVGPWYNLPDGFLVSGESIVRNFLLGMTRSEAFGRTSKVGWLCDIFGHNSQMPQILRQFGIDNAILWRGVDLKAGNPFFWKAADGTSVIVHRFDENGYSDFGFDVRKIGAANENPTADEMVESALKYFGKTKASSSSSNLLWFDGGDHLEFDPKLLEVVTTLNERAGREVVKVSTLDDFIVALRAESPSGLSVQGELREVASMETRAWLIPGVGSSRIPLKQANHAGETLLTLWAEPWCAAANFALGLEYPFQALELAWEYLLKNHPHDSICGCSTDETHAAMPYRFDQSRHIAEFHLETALRALAGTALNGSVKVDEIGLGLFAPAGGVLQNSPEVEVRLPKDWPQFSEFFGFEKKPSMRIFDLVGNEIPYQLLQVQPSTVDARVPLYHFPAVEDRLGIRLALDAALPAGAARHYVLRRTAGPTRIPQQNAIGIGRQTLRNEFIEVSAAPDGTLSLTDLKSGSAYPGLLTLEDTADIGDGWFHGIALRDRAFLSTGGDVSFGITENGPLLARLQIRVEWLVPAGFDRARGERDQQLNPLVVEHLVTLRKGDLHIQIDTTVHNQVRDHRLRVLFPTGLSKARQFSADTPFDAVERPVQLRADNHLMREIQVEMTPQQNWVAITDGQHGLAAVAPGQYESAVLDQPDRPLCVTLLRAFRRAVMTDGNEGGQIQGTHRFRMALKPFSGGVPTAELFQLAQSIAAPVRFVSIETPELAEGTTQPVASLEKRPSVEGAVVLSASYLKRGQEWVFRVFNPSGEPAKVRLSSGTVWRTCDFLGGNAQEVEGSEITVAPKQILTLAGVQSISGISAHATP